MAKRVFPPEWYAHQAARRKNGKGLTKKEKLMHGITKPKQKRTLQQDYEHEMLKKITRRQDKWMDSPAPKPKKTRGKSYLYADRPDGAVGNLRLKKYRKGSGYVQFD